MTSQPIRLQLCGWWCVVFRIGNPCVSNADAVFSTETLQNSFTVSVTPGCLPSHLDGAISSVQFLSPNSSIYTRVTLITINLTRIEDGHWKFWFLLSLNFRKITAIRSDESYSKIREAQNLINPVVAGLGSKGGHAPRAALCMGRHLEGIKYGILKFGRFWRIGVCIAVSDILHPPNTPLTFPQFWDHTP